MSYLFRPSYYLPLFLFPNAKVSQVDEIDFTKAGWFDNLLGQEASTLINNVWARMGGSKQVILAGLNQHQGSYLHLPHGTVPIEVTNLSNVHTKLSAIAPPSQGDLRCRTVDILTGLFSAQRQSKRLVIDENAEALTEIHRTKRGIIVVENASDASPIIAINYAGAIDADVQVVSGLSKRQDREVQAWIQSWKEAGDQTKLSKLKDAVSQRVGSTNFAQFEYATFFTEGLPYSFVLENVIPCSHVDLSLRPDIFVMNNILFESIEPFHSAIIFSPVFFADEETEWLRTFLKQDNYYVRALIGSDASLAKLDFHAQHFPYDLLHICSQGGEVEGYEMSEQFIDESGSTHSVEFEEVVGFTPLPDKPGMVQVHTKALPRKLDGFAWLSEELDKQHFPEDVYVRMWDCIRTSSGPRKKKGRIAMSCAIACADSIHQGEFNILASHTSPVIFNNTCWSWHEVAAFFISCGARAYIGTLWDIENEAAVLAAKAFYTDAFFGPVLAAFHAAVKAIDHTNSKDIYLYWGLHFTTLSPGVDAENSKARVLKELLRSTRGWVRKIKSTKSAAVKKNSISILKSILQEVQTNFAAEIQPEFDSDVRSSVPEISQPDTPRDTTNAEPVTGRRSMDFPLEYKEVEH